MFDPRPPDDQIMDWVSDLFYSFAAAWTSGGATADLETEVLHAEPLGEAIFVVGSFTQDVTLQALPFSSVAASPAFFATLGRDCRCIAWCRSRSAPSRDSRVGISSLLRARAA